jgi:hypothetical protein
VSLAGQDIYGVGGLGRTTGPCCYADDPGIFVVGHNAQYSARSDIPWILLGSDIILKSEVKRIQVELTVGGVRLGLSESPHGQILAASQGDVNFD